MINTLIAETKWLFILCLVVSLLGAFTSCSHDPITGVQVEPDKDPDEVDPPNQEDPESGGTAKVFNYECFPYV